jgi:hypothetical protein
LEERLFRRPLLHAGFADSVCVNTGTESLKVHADAVERDALLQ